MEYFNRERAEEDNSCELNRVYAKTDLNLILQREIIANVVINSLVYYNNYFCRNIEAWLIDRGK